jgi:osmoprotectant transport system ATP-binding protein
MPAMIVLDRVSKHYPGGTNAVSELSLEIDEGETCVLVGPSGCGKSTTLRMINRLIEPSAGRIVVDGEDALRMDPVVLRMKMGYVIQRTGLFPHQTVGQNVATVPRLWGWDRARVRQRVDELLELVGLEPGQYRDRYPHQLSGGQQQRVGFARALGADPPILLMDEPFGAVDRITRERLQNEFLRIQRTLHKTVVFVTHDIDEAVRIGDRIALLDFGAKVEQYATPAEILGRPANDFVRGFLGHERVLKLLTVTPIDRSTLQRSAHPASPPGLAAGASLSDALAELLAGGRETVPVFEGTEYLGDFGPHSLQQSLRALPASEVSRDG